MNILYGVCGEGFGHSSRAKKIIEHLKKENHKVLILTYGNAFKALKEYKPLKVNGFKIELEKEKVSISKTLNSSKDTLIKNIINWDKLNKKIDNFSPKLCITDMEPLVPIIRFWKKLPLISIDNQHRLTHQKIEVPKIYLKDYLIAKNVINTFVSKANHFLILSFNKTKKNSKKVKFVSPILRREIIKLNPKNKDYFLVYLTRPDKKLIKILKKINERFIIYNHTKKEFKKNKLEFKKIGPGFLKNLKDCKAIIGSSGFSLISESLYLKKPYFAIPMKGQFEQTLNALFLKSSKMGEFSENPTKEEIEKFIRELKIYKKRLKNYKSDPYELIIELDKILKSYEKI